MPRGGSRPGAGRKAKEKKAAEQIATQASLPEGDLLRQEIERLGDGFDAKQLMQALYRSKVAPLDVRFTAAAKVLPFETAKPRVNGSAGAGGISFRFGKRDNTA